MKLCLRKAITLMLTVLVLFSMSSTAVFADESTAAEGPEIVQEVLGEPSAHEETGVPAGGSPAGAPAIAEEEADVVTEGADKQEGDAAAGDKAAAAGEPAEGSVDASPAEEPAPAIEDPSISIGDDALPALLKTAETAEDADADEGPVRIRETGIFYPSLGDAVTAANAAGSATIEILGDVTETSSLVIITSDTTIVSPDGAYTIFKCAIQVKGGGKLTLGAGAGAGDFTVSGSVSVSDGSIYVNDGAAIVNASSSPSARALYMNGAKASGAISGGKLEGGIALKLESGATLSEISGGVVTGCVSAVELFGEKSSIGVISGGVFNKTDSTIDRSAFYVDNGAKIGEISGGTFNTITNSSLLLIRGGWVERISGGTFTAHNDTSNGVIMIYSDGRGKAGIGALSGVHVSGGKIGLLLYGRDSTIGSITGGIFESVCALQNDVESVIGSITGGKFTGGDIGVLNVGRIGYIGGQAEIHSEGHDGIYNYPNGQIDEIGGGAITSDVSNGVRNFGAIGLISGGTIIGAYASIDCIAKDPANNGRIGTIMNGVFWGKGAAAIKLAYETAIEPGLSADKGFGRYWGKNGKIFNVDELAVLPGEYFMSARTEAVTDIEGTTFRYLTLADTYTLTYDLNGGEAGTGPDRETGLAEEKEHALNNTVVPSHENAGGQTVVFIGWTAEPDEKVYDKGGKPEGLIDTVDITGDDVTVYAVWGFGGPVTDPPDPDTQTDPIPPTHPDPKPPAPKPPAPKPPAVKPPAVKPPAVSGPQTPIIMKYYSKVPKTGDAADPILYLVLLGASITALYVLSVANKRRETNKD